MAYVANQGEDEDSAQNVATNLFQQNAGGPGGGQPPQAGMSGSPVGREDQSSAIASGTGAATSNAKAPIQSNSASSSKEVIRRNADKVKSPVDVGAVKGDISKARTDLQSEADAYTANQKNNAGAVDQNVINSAIAKGGEDYNKVSQRLTSAMPQYQNFAQKTNTDFSTKLNELSDSGLKNYFKNQGGPQATAGEAAFDAMLLNKNKQFKQDRADAQLQAKTLDEESKKIRDATDVNAKAEYEKAYGSETGRIKDSINSQANSVRSQAEAAAAEENKIRSYLKNRTAEQFNQEHPDYAQWLQGLSGQVGAQGDEGAYLSNQLHNPNTGYTKFVNVNPQQVSAGNYLNQDQAAMLARSNSLTGAGGPVYNAAGGAGPSYSYDADAAKAYLSGILKSKRDNEQKRAEIKASLPADMPEDQKNKITMGDITEVAKKAAPYTVGAGAGAGAAKTFDEASKYIDVPSPTTLPEATSGWRM